jgi:BASS family bile acid:Na+ symporter
MFAMGLTLTTAQIREQIKRFGLMGKALLANMVIVPLAAVILLQLSNQPDAVVVAIVLVACAPGYAPMLTAYSKGDLPFTAVLMFVMAVVSVVSLPLTASLILASLGGSINLDPMSVIGTLVTLQLIPLLLGMIVNGIREQIAARLVPIFSTIARIAVIVALLAILVLFFNEITGTIWSALILMVVLAMVALVSGYLLGGPGDDTRRTLALNTVVRNLGLALLVSSSQFSGLGAEIVVIAFAFVMYTVAAITTRSWFHEFLKPV